MDENEKVKKRKNERKRKFTILRDERTALERDECRGGGRKNMRLLVLPLRGISLLLDSFLFKKKNSNDQVFMFEDLFPAWFRREEK